MFDQILKLFKEHFNDNPELSAAIPPGQEEAVHNEIASQIANHPAVAESRSGSLLASLENSLASGSPVASAIEGGLIGSLGSKFGLSPAITGAVSAALPSILAKYANRSDTGPQAGATPQQDMLSEAKGMLGKLF